MKMHRLFFCLPLLIFCALANGATYGPSPVVDSIASMTNRNASANPATIHALGTQGGEFQILTASEATNSSDFTAGYPGVYFRTTNGLYYKRLVTSPIDPRWFGATPYQSGTNTMAPYTTQIEDIEAIGTDDFSVWMRMKMPSATYPISMGGYIIGPNTNTISQINTFEFRGAGFGSGSSAFGFVFRGVGSGSDTTNQSVLDSTWSAFSAFTGTTVDLVVIRDGTNATVYLNGTNVTSEFTLTNPNGWAKSLAGDTTLMAQVGNVNNTGYFWPEPIHRFGLFNRALSSNEVTGDLSSVTSGRIAYWTGINTSAPPDASTGIQAAIDYASAAGGGIVDIPAGNWRVSQPIRIKPYVAIRGEGKPSMWSGVYNARNMAPTKLIPFYAATNDVFVALAEDATKEQFFYFETDFLTSGSYYMNSSIENLAIVGQMARNSRGIYCDRVAFLTFKNIAMVQLPNTPIYSVIGNGLDIEAVTGANYKGYYLKHIGDTAIVNCHNDGTFGPAMYLLGGLVHVRGNRIEAAADQFPAVAALRNFAGEITVDPNTDIFTKANHGLRTLDPVYFKNANGELPSPLFHLTDYYVVRLSDDTFKVNDIYIDTTDNSGAYYGEGIDITTAGTGTNYVTHGPSVGIMLRGDHNTLVNNRIFIPHEESLLLYLASGNTIENNLLNGAFFANTSTNYTAKAAVRLNSSFNNVFIGNNVADRDTNLNAIVYYEDDISTNNIFWGSTRGRSGNNLTQQAGNQTNDFRVAYQRSEHGNVTFARGYLPNSTTNGLLVVPGISGEPTGVPFPEHRLGMVYGTNQWLFGYDAFITNWLYTPFVRSTSSNSWLALEPGGTLKITGDGGEQLILDNQVGNSGVAFSIHGAYTGGSGKTYIESYSTNADEGIRQHWHRGNGIHSFQYNPLEDDTQIISWRIGGATGTNALDRVGFAGSIEAFSDGAWNTTNVPVRWEIGAAGPGDASSVVRATVDGQADSDETGLKLEINGTLRRLKAATNSSMTAYFGDAFTEVGGAGATNTILLVDATAVAGPNLSSASDIDFSISGSTNILASIGANAVTSTKIADGTIETTDLNDGIVTSNKLSANAVNAEKILDGSIVTADLADSLITSNKLASDVVNDAKVLDGSLATADFADSSITSNKIASSAINAAKVLDGSLVTADYADSSVTSNKLASGAINDVKILDGSITTADLADALITSNKVFGSSINSAKILDGSIIVDDIANSTLTGAKITTNTIPLAAIVDMNEQRLAGRGEGDGSGPMIEVQTEGGTYITNFWSGPAFGFDLVTNDIPLLSRNNLFTGATNEFRTIVSTNFQTDEMTIDDLEVAGELTLDGTNVLDLIGDAAGSKTIASFLPTDAQVTTNTTGYADFSVRGDGRVVLNFNATTSDCMFFGGVIPEGAILTSGIRATFWTAGGSATSGTNVFTIEFEKLDGLDLDGNSFATSTNVLLEASGTSGIPTKASVTSTFTDSLASEDSYRIRVCRTPGDSSDNMTGEAQLIRLMLKTAN